MKTNGHSIQLPVVLDGTLPHKDGSMGLRFDTQELTDAEKLIVLQHLGKFGWMLFKPDGEWSEAEVPKEDSGYEEKASPSQRLRAVMFVYWEKYKKEEHADFEVWYRAQIEGIILQYKEKMA